MMEAREDHHESFRAALASNGLPTADVIVGDSVLHRFHVDGDKPHDRSGWYVLHLDAHPKGVFGCNRRYGGQSFKWSAKGAKRLSRAERKAAIAEMKAAQARRIAEEKVRHDAAAARANEIWNGAAGADPAHPYLVNKQVAAYGLRQGVWVKEWHDEGTGEVFEKRVENALLIPVKRSSKEIVSLQAIFPSKENPIGRGKDFLSDGAKRGCYFPIGKLTEVDGRKVVVFCEGYATGASVHAATGLGVIVAFDAGNLEAVAVAMRPKLPNALFVFAADNDQWTMRPIKNPGLTRATEAAKAVGGVVALPVFADLQGRPKDFNDLALREGAEAVREMVMTVITDAKNAPAPGGKTGLGGAMDGASDAPLAGRVVTSEVMGTAKSTYNKVTPRIDTSGPSIQSDTANVLEGNPWFTPLGYDRNNLFFFNHDKNMIQEVPETYTSIKNKMLPVAPLDWWERQFPGDKGVNEKAAVNAVIRLSYRVGYFDPGIIRGRGAWIDQGRVVFHCGDKLLVDGVETECSHFDSRYIYEEGCPLPRPAATPLTDGEGIHLYQLASRFRWEHSSSALLLLGWCALAPVCGALEWRPHAWLTGGAGSGKTKIQTIFVQRLTSKMTLVASGSSTEAGLRQELGGDALSIQFDESEQNTLMDEGRVQGIISLCRQTSSETGGRVYKGGKSGVGLSFQPRPMALFSSIGTMLKSAADRDRFTIMSLKPRSDSPCAAAEWAALEADLRWLTDDANLPQRVLRRTIDLLPTTRKNIKLFSLVAAERFGSAREGDQYGTLLAGAWSLMSNREATRDDVLKMIDDHDWSGHFEHKEADDSERALSAILEATVRRPGGDVSIAELAKCVAFPASRPEGLTAKEADAMLRRHGLRVRKCGTKYEFLISPHHTAIPKLLLGTGFENNYFNHLRNHKHAIVFKNSQRAGHKLERCAGIDLEEFLAEEADTTDAAAGAAVIQWSRAKVVHEAAP